MKKHQQLGMNASTASGRLVKDLLFKFVVEAGHTCFRCGGALTRQDFSVEHKFPWLDSEDPVGTFFDLSNIAFSHFRCNSAAGSGPEFQKSKTMCPHGHPYDSTNTYQLPSGARRCRECHRAHNRLWKREQSGPLGGE